MRSALVGGMVVASAPGRVCLVGEHNDWAGGAALVVPMDRCARVTAEDAATWSFHTRLEGRELSWSSGEAGAFFLAPATLEVLRSAGIAPRPAQVRIESDIPPGRGFSSSAAVAVALVRALAERAGVVLSPDRAAELAYRAEHDVGGVPCGRLDPLAVAHALPLFLQFDGEGVEVETLPARLDLAVGSLGAGRDTRGILTALNRYFRGEVPLRDWEAIPRVGAVRGAIEGFGAQARHARAALLEGDLRALGGAMDTCQDIYEEELMPVIPELHAPRLVRAVRALRAAGALGAKFSGAGGEGSVVGLFPPDGPVGAGVRALDTLGVESFAVEVWCSV